MSENPKTCTLCLRNIDNSLELGPAIVNNDTIRIHYNCLVSLKPFHGKEKILHKYMFTSKDI